MDEKGKRIEEITRRLSRELDGLPRDGTSSEISVRIEHCHGHIVGQQFTVHHYDPEHCRRCHAGQAVRDHRSDMRALMWVLALAVAAAIVLPQVLGGVSLR